jgi:excinuclease ABC subunit A
MDGSRQQIQDMPDHATCQNQYWPLQRGYVILYSSILIRAGTMTAIEIRGARTHNLKNIDCRFSHGQLSVITGVSGSGKSSLAFDTLFAEGHRRFTESLSTYVRQFLDRMERPDYDSMSGIQPAIALEQKNNVRSARSTVGTATEIHDYLRLLFAKIGQTVCSECRNPVYPETTETTLTRLTDLETDERLLILAPTQWTIHALSGKRGANLRHELVHAGYHRLWNGREIIDLTAEEPSGRSKKPLYILIDRLKLQPSNRARLRAAVETAYQAGHGQATVYLHDRRKSLDFSQGMNCTGCGRSFPRPEPHLFSFYSPIGACPSCEGFGRIMELDLDKVIPNRELCIEDGAIAPWNSEGNLEWYDMIRGETTPSQIPRLKPVEDFNEKQLHNLLEGCGSFPGILAFFKYLEKKKYRVQSRVMLARYRAYHPCPDCRGTRLKPDALNVKIRDRDIAALSLLPVKDLLDFVENLELTGEQKKIAGRVIETIISRLSYLVGIGLDYLTLDRQTRTLSGGEAQRINLTTSLGSALTETLYILDEPTVGMHASDTDRLIRTLHQIRDLGNTIVVVEHDMEVIRSADWLIDLGPGAGELGGEILYAGTPGSLQEKETATAEYLRHYDTPSVPSRERKSADNIIIHQATGHNLRDLTVSIPLGVLCCITGVSGSGKTTLIRDTLCANYRRLREIAPVETEPCSHISGLEKIDALNWVDQMPLTATRRSNPATYVKAYEWIRKTLAETREARALGLTARDFSFNVEGGRCPACKGTGHQTIDMHFMADVEIICEKCDGKRFQQRVLQLAWKGSNIHDILDMTVQEAVRFFKSEPKVARAFKPLMNVGLGYLKLGQNTTTLSGGESQRLKLAGRLVQMREDERELLVFDEPTTGLHSSDQEKFLNILHSMVDRGCSLVVIEHNLELIAGADHIIDLGPGGGDHGGRIVAEGTPREIMRNEDSITGRYLKRRFSGNW